MLQRCGLRYTVRAVEGVECAHAVMHTCGGVRERMRCMRVLCAALACDVARGPAAMGECISLLCASARAFAVWRRRPRRWGNAYPCWRRRRRSGGRYERAGELLARAAALLPARGEVQTALDEWEAWDGAGEWRGNGIGWLIF